MINAEEIFCKVDDFYLKFEFEFRKQLLKNDRRRDRAPELSVSEMMTIMILFHQSCFRYFKEFYLGYVCRVMRPEFPRLVSYNRFVQLLPRIVVPLMAFLNSVKGRSTGISFIDSTSLAVCKNKRIARNKVSRVQSRSATPGILNPCKKSCKTEMKRSV